MVASRDFRPPGGAGESASGTVQRGRAAAERMCRRPAPPAAALPNRGPGCGFLCLRGRTGSTPDRGGHAGRAGTSGPMRSAGRTDDLPVRCFPWLSLPVAAGTPSLSPCLTVTGNLSPYPVSPPGFRPSLPRLPRPAVPRACHPVGSHPQPGDAPLPVSPGGVTLHGPQQGPTVPSRKPCFPERPITCSDRLLPRPATPSAGEDAGGTADGGRGGSMARRMDRPDSQTAPPCTPLALSGSS